MNSVDTRSRRRCVLLSYSIKSGVLIFLQCKLFHSIKPLFAGKPVVLVINKIDVCRLEDLAAEPRALVEEIIKSEDVQHIQVSCYSEEGVMDLKNKACDALLSHRVEAKLKGSKINTVINRIHVAQPKPRDDIERKPFIPEVVLSKKKYDPNDPERPRLEKDIEAEEGGAGVYNINIKSTCSFLRDIVVLVIDLILAENYILENDEWKFDIMPEIMDGKNIADFIDPDIEEKLEALEREEERLQAEGFYDSESDMYGSEDEREAAELKYAQEKRLESQITQKQMKNHAKLPRTAGLRTLSDMTDALTKAGLDPSRVAERAAVIAKAQGVMKKRKRAEEGMDVDMDGAEDDGEGEWMDVDGEDSTPKKRSKMNTGTAVVAKSKREPRSNRQLAGMRDDAVSLISSFMYHFSQPDFLFTASVKSCQVAQPRTTREEYVCKSWRERSRYQSQNGTPSNFPTLHCCSNLHDSSRNTSSRESEKWARQTDGDAMYMHHHFLILFRLLLSYHLPRICTVCRLLYLPRTISHMERYL